MSRLAAHLVSVVPLPGVAQVRQVHIQQALAATAVGDDDFQGVAALQRPAAAFGFEFVVLRRSRGGLWQQLVGERRLWPSSEARWCSVNCTCFTWLIMTPTS